MVTGGPDGGPSVEGAGDPFADAGHLLDALDMPMLFLDRDLSLRRLTPSASDLLGVRGDDLGRPVSDLALPGGGDLLADTRAVLSDPAPVGREVRIGGRWYDRTVRPLRTGGLAVLYAGAESRSHALEALSRRERHSAAAIELGHLILKGGRLKGTMREMCRILRNALDADFSGVMALEEDGAALRVAAGSGWPKSMIGAFVVPGDSSQAGYTLRTGGPVVMDDLASETRFGGLDPLRSNGVRSGISCPIGPPAEPFGVLGVHSKQAYGFHEEDTDFLRTVANLLYGAILRRRMTDELSDRELVLSLAMRAARMGAFVFDPGKDSVTMDPFVHELFDIEPGTPLSWEVIRDRIVPEDLDATVAALDAAVRGEGHYKSEFRVRRRDGSVRWLAGYGDADGRDGDRLVFGVNFDVTDRKESEERQRFIARELDHRVKNVLATVAAVASLAGQSAGSLAEFRDSLTARIKSLANLHALLADSFWSGIDLADLVRGELASYEGGGAAVAVEGPPVTLPPETAQTLGLAVHELATNAAKHGAIRHDGRIDVRWKVASGSGGRQLDFRWQEEGIAPPGKEERTGFGTTVIGPMVAQHLGAEVERERTPERISVRYRLPLTGTAPTLGGPRKPRPANETAAPLRNAGDPRPHGRGRADLTGKRVLLVEDEFLIGLEMADLLRGRGAEVTGPVARLDRALKRVDEAFDLAVLDFNVAGHAVTPLAQALASRGVGVVICSGYGANSGLFEDVPDIPRIAKPVTEEALDGALTGLLAG